MRVLMVSTEYPPMSGGVARYTANLTKAVRKAGVEVAVLCAGEGAGQLSGLSPTNRENSAVITRAISEIKPDVVHVQFEPGLYGLVLDSAHPKRSHTYADSFYAACNVPLVTTFHSTYTLRQWMAQVVLVKKEGRIGRLGIPARMAVKAWKNIMNYRAFERINKEKLHKSDVGILFSDYAAKRLGGGQVIYHGAEPAIDPLAKAKARSILSLPEDGRIALVLGFLTASKGWDILRKMELPKGWTAVINSSRGHYNIENLSVKIDRPNMIDLQRGFLTEEMLSMLFYASDAVILPYKITSGSGVMFDALAHGLPFVASNLDFFQEFSSQGLGIAVKRAPKAFSQGLERLDADYDMYCRNVGAFREKLRWDYVAKQHIECYARAANRKAK